MAKPKSNDVISQVELDNLLKINDLIESDTNDSLLHELKQAILDSGKLDLRQWVELRRQLHEIEELIPHIDLIIRLKTEG